MGSGVANADQVRASSNCKTACRSCRNFLARRARGVFCGSPPPRRGVRSRSPCPPAGGGPWRILPERATRSLVWLRCCRAPVSAPGTARCQAGAGSACFFLAMRYAAPGLAHSVRWRSITPATLARAMARAPRRSCPRGGHGRGSGFSGVAAGQTKDTKATLPNACHWPGASRPGAPTRCAVEPLSGSLKACGQVTRSTGQRQAFPTGGCFVIGRRVGQRGGEVQGNLSEARAKRNAGLLHMVLPFGTVDLQREDRAMLESNPSASCRRPSQAG